MRYFAVALALIASPALAIEQPKFVPFTVTADDLKALNSRLEELPIKTLPAAQTVGQWLNDLEQKAVAQAAKPADQTPSPAQK